MPIPNAEEQNWLKCSDLILIVLLPAMRILFKQKWNATFPGYIWTNDSTSGDVFMNGSPDWTPWVVTQSLGTVSLQNGKTQGRTTEDWQAKGIEQGDQIRIRDSSGTEHFLEVLAFTVVHAYGSPNMVNFKQPYPGPTEPACATALGRRCAAP